MNLSQWKDHIETKSCEKHTSEKLHIISHKRVYYNWTILVLSCQNFHSSLGSSELTTYLLSYITVWALYTAKDALPMWAILHLLRFGATGFEPVPSFAVTATQIQQCSWTSTAHQWQFQKDHELCDDCTVPAFSQQTQWSGTSIIIIWVLVQLVKNAMR